MAGGGLMSLVAYGAQDIYLTGNPQITYWKLVYRRHTNFAMESIEQSFNGVANFGKRVTCTISRNGDLISRMYLQATLPSVDLYSIVPDTSGAEFRWINWPGHNLINSVEIEIGGQKIDKQYGEWLHIWNELSLPAGKQSGYAEMVGNVPQLVNLITQVGPDGGCDSACIEGVPHTAMEARSCTPEYTMYIPFLFWFNRHAGLALPLIALQYHEVKLNLILNDAANMIWSNNQVVRNYVNTTGLIAASIYVDYIYLDTEERKRFAQVAHEYLIEQLQFTGDESITSSANKIKMSYNHPVKEVIWVTQPAAFVAQDGSMDAWKGIQPFNFTDYFDRAALESGYSITLMKGMAGSNPTVTAKIQLNGHDRFSEREGRYFNHVQPYQHHTNIPSTGINVYSFALNAEDHQPSGTTNFSRIDNATLVKTVSNNAVGNGKTANVRIYAINYNVLRIMSGMGGLAYSN